MLHGLTGKLNCAHRLFYDVLRHFVSADMQDWVEHLKIAQFAISDSWQESVQETPMYLDRGRHPKSPLAVNLPTLPIDNPSADFAAQTRTLTARAQHCIAKAETLL